MTNIPRGEGDEEKRSHGENFRFPGDNIPSACRGSVVRLEKKPAKCGIFKFLRPEIVPSLACCRVDPLRYLSRLLHGGGGEAPHMTHTELLHFHRDGDINISCRDVILIHAAADIERCYAGSYRRILEDYRKSWPTFSAATSYDQS